MFASDTDSDRKMRVQDGKLGIGKNKTVFAKGCQIVSKILVIQY